MIIKHNKAKDLIKNSWSGGTTTQLFIYPETSSYQERNFLFRISTASVETEESEFTKLPGIHRKLMILDGEIKIEHQDHHTKILKKFEQDKFMGDWDTKSYGKATDFNLMNFGKTHGFIETLMINKNEIVELNIEYNFTGLYIFLVKLKLMNIKLKQNREILYTC